MPGSGGFEGRCRAKNCVDCWYFAFLHSLGQEQPVRWAIKFVFNGQHFLELESENNSMHRTSAIQIIASTIGLAVLCVIVTAGTAFLSTDVDYTSNAIVSNLVAIGCAAAAWTGVLWRKSKTEPKGPASWREWLAVFAGGLTLSLVFLLFDCGGRLPIFHPKFVCDGNPGFSVIFTVGAICLTVIAIPSAIRAWILKKFGGAP